MTSFPSTLLELTGIDYSPYSVRDLSMEMAPISGAGQFARDINGTLHFIGGIQFRKYRATISCQDHFPPELIDTWPGTEVFVKCIPNMLTADPSKEPIVLQMLVTNFTANRREAAAQSSWAIELEQV